MCPLFVFYILSGKIDSLNSLSKLNIFTPLPTLKNHNLIRLDQHRTNYELFEPMTNVSRIFNRFLHILGIERLDTITRYSFRSMVRSSNAKHRTSTYKY